MCSVAHIFERLGLIRARCVCGPRRRKETRQFVTATSALEMELMTPGASASACVTPQKTQSSLRLQGQGSNRRTTRTGRLTSHNRAITNPKLREISSLLVLSVWRSERGRVGGGPYMKSERKRRGGGGGAGAQSIHVWCHKRPNPTDQGPSPRSIAVNRNSRYLRGL